MYTLPDALRFALHRAVDLGVAFGTDSDARTFADRLVRQYPDSEFAAWWSSEVRGVRFAFLRCLVAARPRSVYGSWP